MNIRYLILYISFFIPICTLAHSGDFSSIEFVKNQGQWDGPFAYKASFGNINIFLEKNAFTYTLGDRQNVAKAHDYKFGKLEKAPKYKFHTYKVKMLNANTKPEILGSKEQSYYYNYFLGNDSSKWKTGIHPELNVDYKNIYNGIDIHIASENHNMKYDFIVHSGANPDDIVLEIEGANDVKLKDKNLVIETSVGEVTEMAPYAYQYINGSRIDVPCKYKLKDNRISYAFPKGYNESQTLIIDPNVVFATFTGSTADNWGFTATYDDTGNFYAGGIAGGVGYPRNVGPTWAGGDGADGNNSGIRSDIVVTKFNPGGTNFVYSTYIGGSSQDQPHSMVVDRNGNLFLAGRTYSQNYPSTNGSAHKGGSDIIITKLGTNGAVTASAHIGGTGDDGVNISALFGTTSILKHSYADDARSEIIADNAGNVYIASCTRSSDFPTVNASKNTLTGAQDGVIVKMNNNLSNTLWSTYLGGNREDAAYVLAFNTTQSSIYVSGGTASTNFSGNAGTFGPSYNGGVADGYIMKFQNGGSYAIQRSTLVGRASYDQCFGIQVDNENNVYVMGQTLGGTFPVTSGVYSNPNSSQFVLKLDSTLSTNIYSTVYGSGTSNAVNISPVAFLVDTCQNVYISGWGGAVANNGGNTSNMPVQMGTPRPTPAGILDSNSNGSDFYFIVLSKNAASLLFGAYYGGGSTDEHVDGGTSRFNENGVVYQAICGGCGGSSSVPTTTGAFSTTNGSSNCNIIALKIAFNLGSVSAKANASPNTVICLGEAINFSSNGSANATSYEWDFGDGNTTTGTNPSHTYTTGGTFNVQMVAVNPNACKTRDTVNLQVIVDTNSIKADFDYSKTDSCTSFATNFTNTSKYGNNPNNATFQWIFGDGSSFTGANPTTHTYADSGTYTVTLIMTDPDACNSPDTVQKIISFNNKFVKAEFEAPEVICERSTAVLLNKSSNAVTYLWDFGNGNTSNSINPEPLYDTAGTYKIKLYTYNPETCNGVDSIEKTIEVKSTPYASFRHTPIIPETNEPITFTNYSERATSYIWDFGDGTGSGVFNPEPKFYRKTGEYLVCLQALNEIGCSDTVCRKVSADVYPLADVPTGFSPNGDGKNDILYVRGYGIETLSFKVFNRWGELVFETTDQDLGWDGTYKNKEQPVEAYAYIMAVTFIDGTTFQKKGNVTLLR